MAGAAPPLLLAALLVGAATLRGVAGISILACFNSLEVDAFLENGPYRLTFKRNCSLALTRNAQSLWGAGSKEGVGCKAELEGSGDLVIKDVQGSRLWSSNSTQQNRNYLILDSSGNVSIKTLKTGEKLWTAIYSAPPPVAAPDPAPGSPGPPPQPAPDPSSWEVQAGVLYMVAGYHLPVGTPLQNIEFTLRLNASCYLELLRSGTVEWKSETGGSEGDKCTLFLGENGALQILSGDGSVAWKSNYSGLASTDSYVLYLDDNGDVSVYNSLELKTAVWTGFKPATTAARQTSSRWWKIVVGVVAGFMLAVIAGGVFWMLTTYYGCAPGWVDPAAKQLKGRLQANGGRCEAVSLAKITQATNGFDTKLGEGGFGAVYLGKLDGQEVAIKVLSATSHQGKPEFFNEIELLSMVHHKYLVSLVGYCLAWNKQILVYEYISGGDLQGRLRGEKAATNPLTWNERTNIILQVAEGIEYLHHGCPRAIIHRDLKSSNILLTDKLIAKVSDFGLSKLVAKEQDATHITTVVKGTFGYLDPEYSITGNLTEKSDVYAFGVLLMETLTGGPLTDNEGLFLGMRVRQALKSGQVEFLADPNMPGSYNAHQFIHMMQLASWCLKKHGYDRPSMSQVVQELKETGLVLMGPLKSMPHGVSTPVDEVSIDLPSTLESSPLR